MKSSRPIANRRYVIKDLVPIVFFILLIVFFTAMNQRFFSLENFSTLLRQSSILLIISLGANFVIMIGSIDLSVGQSVSLAGVTAALLINQIGWLVIFVGIGVGIIVGLLNGTICVFGRIPSFLTTLATSSMLKGISLIISSGTPVPLRIKWFTALSNESIIGGIPNIFLWAIALYSITVFIQFKTAYGRHIFAVGGAENVAKLSGINVKKIKMMVFCTAGIISGLAGVLLASRIGSAYSDMGEPFVMDSIATVVIGGTALTGGTGGVHKNLLGVIVIAVLGNGMDVVGIHPYVQVLVKGIVIILSVISSMDRTKLQVVK